MKKDKTLATKEIEEAIGSRRDFLKFCTAVAVAMGLGPAGAKQVAAALTGTSRPVVLWLHFAECTACTEAVLRTVNPYIDDLLLDTISMDYHETIMAGAGSAVHDRLYSQATANNGQFIAVVECAIPTAQNGIYGTVGGKTMLQIAQDILPKAKAIICIGTCSSYGGVQAAAPNPTGAKGVRDALPALTVPIVNVPGCPPNPISFVGTVVTFLTTGAPPALDSIGRPLAHYQYTVHGGCSLQDTPRCLIEKGCKGPITRNNCSDVLFNEGTNNCVLAGHPCIGCCEPDFWDRMTSFYYTNYGDVAVKYGYKLPVSLERRESGTAHMYDLRGRSVGVFPASKNSAMQAQKQLSPGAYITKTSKNIVKKIGL
jgi:[NiFe] hydrogenase small subunit